MFFCFLEFIVRGPVENRLKYCRICIRLNLDVLRPQWDSTVGTVLPGLEPIGFIESGPSRCKIRTSRDGGCTFFSVLLFS